MITSTARITKMIVAMILTDRPEKGPGIARASVAIAPMISGKTVCQQGSRQQPDEADEAPQQGVAAQSPMEFQRQPLSNFSIGRIRRYKAKQVACGKLVGDRQREKRDEFA